ncbi:hypothetical protein [Streptomyces macrosporus]|uniref:Uncharacterized protein n=1 Tax=Streptomyces macrosporus TaxID=44032 RepID=A0ABP5WK54_9ACTN
MTSKRTERLATQSPKGKTFIEKAAYVVTPGTVVFGLLYYFGNMYYNAYYSYFGIHASDLALTTQDRLVGSPPAIFLPLWAMLAVGFAVFLVFPLVKHRIFYAKALSKQRRAQWIIALLGAFLVLLSFPIYMRAGWWMAFTSRFLPRTWLKDLVPLSLVAAGALLLLLVLYLKRGAGQRGDRSWRIAEGCIIAMVAMVVFYATTQYAGGAGRSKAASIARSDYVGLTPVLIHSKTPIFPSSPAAQCEDRGAAYMPYRFRCKGFRVLAKSSTRFFLVPWQRPRDGDITLVLRDDDTIRVEVLGRSRRFL